MRCENPGELFAVERPTAPGADASLPFTRAEYEAMRRETSRVHRCFRHAAARPDPHRRPPGDRPPSSLETSSRRWESTRHSAAR